MSLITRFLLGNSLPVFLIGAAIAFTSYTYIKGRIHGFERGEKAERARVVKQGNRNAERSQTVRRKSRNATAKRVRSVSSDPYRRD